MSVLPLVEETDPILLQKPNPFNWDDPQIDPEELEKNLIDSMIEHKGIGLSANQVGIPLSVFSMYWDDKPIVVFNPYIVEYSNETTYMKEGCLSYPGLFIAIKRSESVKVEFDVKDSSSKGAVFNGMSSKIFQHEMDHMEGREFFSDVSEFKLKQALKKRKYNLKKMKKRWDNI
jgi:peptide deformylase